MESYIVDWTSLILRFLHIITGIAWIGASFYTALYICLKFCLHFSADDLYRALIELMR